MYAGLRDAGRAAGTRYAGGRGAMYGCTPLWAGAACGI